jgi:hypothetical protein
VSTFASLHSSRNQIPLTFDSTSELIKDWSKHTTLFLVEILGLMLQVGIGEKGDNLSASVGVQLREIDKIGCRQNGRVAESRAKQSEIFPFFSFGHLWSPAEHP